MSSAAAKFFSCYTTCGSSSSVVENEEEPACVDYNPKINSTNMKRASLSRREHPLQQQSPVMRSRSQERLGDTPQKTATAAGDNDMRSMMSLTNNNDDQQADIFLDASQNFLAESTDNDSANDLSGDDDNVVAATAGNRNKTNSMSNQMKRGIHVRAMSDPFDTQEMQDALQEQQQDDQNLFAPSSKVPAITTTAAALSKEAAYPTLLRFPVQETRNKNCWSEPPVTTFSVRGPNYFVDKKKQTSAAYLLSARGTDIFLFDGKPVCLQERSHLILGGHLRSVPTLLINFQFPWGVMVLYFEVPNKLAPYINNTNTKNGNTGVPIDAALSHSEKTLAKWLQGDDNYKNDRLKLIPYVAEGPWVVRNMVTGRPAIIGRKLPVTYRTVSASHNAAPLLECTLDIGSSSATAKRIVSVCRRYMSGLSADIGFVIQAEKPAELPEQMMGCIRVHGPDPLKAPKI